MLATLLHCKLDLTQWVCEDTDGCACRFLPDRAMREQGTSRIFWLVVLTLLTACAALLNAFLDLRLLGLACTISGLAFGGMQGIVPAIISELFGMQVGACVCAARCRSCHL